MDSDTRKNLYLLEVMVENIKIDADVLLKCFTFDPEKVRAIDVQARVDFSNNFELVIDCEASVYRGLSERTSMKSESKTTLNFEKTLRVKDTIDWPSGEPDSSGTTLQAGKSCLFPMSAERMMAALESCPLYIQVYSREDEATIKSDECTADIFLGKAKLDLSAENFHKVVASAEACVNLPITAFLRSTLPLKTTFGDVSGKIQMYVRLSCFGKSILSGFSFIQQGHQKLKDMDGKMRITEEFCNESAV